MSKRVSVGDRVNKDDNKYTKAISAYTSDGNANLNEKNNNTDNSTKKNESERKNKIIIERNIEKANPKRSTYYLMPETIEKIEIFSNKTGIGKSALVQMLLDDALDRVEVK